MNSIQAVYLLFSTKDSPLRGKFHPASEKLSINFIPLGQHQGVFNLIHKLSLAAAVLMASMKNTLWLMERHKGKVFLDREKERSS